LESGGNVLQIDFATKTMRPPDPAFIGMILRFGDYIARRAERAGTSLIACNLQFGIPEEIFEKAPDGMRHRCQIVLNLQEQSGRCWSHSMRVWAWPHDPKRESRSTRIENQARPGVLGPTASHHE
jgi:hypothetical protein